jgi:hypothetical protein
VFVRGFKNRKTTMLLFDKTKYEKKDQEKRAAFSKLGLVYPPSQEKYAELRTVIN